MIDVGLMHLVFSFTAIGVGAWVVLRSLTRFVMPRIAPSLSDHAQAWGAFWTSASVASFGVMGIGVWLIKTRLPAAVAKTPDAMRQEKRALREKDMAVVVGGSSVHAAEA